MSNLINEKSYDSYVCEFCGKRYVKERSFLQHKCKQKTRFEHSKTPRGQLAYHLYVKWLSKTYNSKKVSLEAFLTSSSYAAFVRFVDWGLEVELPGIDRYVDFVSMKKYTPVMWTYPEVYSQFMEFLDVKMTAEDHVEITIKTLSKVSSERGCTIDQVLNVLTPGEIIQLIVKRRLSPWILLKTLSFKTRWKDFNMDVRAHIGRVINADYWKTKMQRDSNGTKLVESVVSRLKL